MRRLTEFTWHCKLKHPDYLPRLNSANLHRARHLQGSARAGTELATDQHRARGPCTCRVQGVFRSGVDPMQLHVSIAAWVPVQRMRHLLALHRVQG